MVHQLPGVIALTYDLCLTRTISRYKDLSKNYNFGKTDISPWMHVAPSFPKKCRLGPQNGSGSLGPEKLLIIVNCATIKETEKLKEIMVGVQVDLASGHQYPPGSLVSFF